MSKKESREKNPRLGKVGGQAVLEGVMMKSGDEVCICVRKEDGTIEKKNNKFVSLRKKHKFCNVPIIRGVINFVEMLRLSMGTLNDSAEMMGIDDAEAETKFEKWLTDKLGDKLMGVIMGLATVLGLALSLVLFVFLPTVIIKGISYFTGELNWAVRSLLEGVMKIAIFVAYIALCGLIPDIRRTFEYHGSEHKSIACYEAGLELTPANAATCTRFHPRCGTSFIFVMLVISILVSMFIHIDNVFLRTAVKLLLLPVSVGLGFEFIMFAGKHDNAATRILSAPGLWMQRITTKEPTEEMLEVAISALKGAMPDEFPEETASAENDIPDDAEQADA
ncbi:MAG: DUF1385 domain-containing protein [Clostridia bacterium]|nr:DUF1385 domain-containing protein [Clostridia bacterium]